VEDNKSLEGCNIVIDDVNLEEKGDGGMRGSRLEKRSSSLVVNSKSTIRHD
jgi:hypothetical protein